MFLKFSASSSCFPNKNRIFYFKITQEGLGFSIKSIGLHDTVIRCRLMPGWTEIIRWFSVQPVENFGPLNFQIKVTPLIHTILPQTNIYSSCSEYSWMVVVFQCLTALQSCMLCFRDITVITEKPKSTTWFKVLDVYSEILTLYLKTFCGTSLQ